MGWCISTTLGERVELAGGRICSEVGVLHTLLLVVVGGVVVFFFRFYLLSPNRQMSTFTHSLSRLAYYVTQHRLCGGALAQPGCRVMWELRRELQ